MTSLVIPLLFAAVFPAEIAAARALHRRYYNVFQADRAAA